jgi:hypothetical protein
MMAEIIATTVRHRRPERQMEKITQRLFTKAIR